MKSIHIQLYIGFALAVACTGCYNYRAVDPVVFEKPVDTSVKDVEAQVKRTWSFGDLEVSNTFDGARVNEIRQQDDSTFIVYIRPENRPINPSPWYAFQVRADSGATYYFVLDYGENTHRYHPKVIQDGESLALDTTDVAVIADHQARVRLQMPGQEVILAAQPVVSSTDVHDWMDTFARRWSLKYRTYGKSREGRPLKYLEINQGRTQKPLIVLLCRQHPPEVTGWFAMQYFLMEIMENAGLSDPFLDKYRVLVYPMLNPDGVDGGFWRHNAAGVDLNRDWSVYNQPEIAQTVGHLAREARDRPVLLALDFHSTYHDIFYTNDESGQPSALPGFKDAWLDGLRSEYPAFVFEEKNSMPQTPVSKNWFYRYFNAAAVTYEIGDETPAAIIELKGRASASMMMRLLTDGVSD